MPHMPPVPRSPDAASARASAPVSTLDRLYPWRGAAPADLELACTQIARRLIAAGRRAIGFVPVAGSGDLLPLLVRLAAALYPFQQRQAAVIPDWPTWDSAPPETRRLGADEHGPTLRPLAGEAGPTLLVPPPCPDGDTAALSLQLAVRRLEKKFPQALIDLTGFAGRDAAEIASASRLVDGVAVVATPGRTSVASLKRASRLVPAEKNLGALLIG